MPAAKSKTPPTKPPKEAGPDDLVREAAGSYVSGDRRFRVDQSESNWYLVDTEQTNEFGQELIHGPFGTLKAVKEAVSGARTVKPLLRSAKRTGSATRRTTKKPTQPPPPPPPTWLDKLPPKEAAEARALIRALAREGITDAEALVKRDRAGLQPAIASALLKRRVDAVIDRVPENESALARRLIDQLGEVIDASEAGKDPLPGWALYETGPGREPTRRRLRLGG
jgi:hypothetical protein